MSKRFWIENGEIVDNCLILGGSQVVVGILNAQDAKISDLEAKLDEKKKEIEQLKKFDDLNKTFFDLFRTAFKEPNKVDDLFNTLKTIQEKQDQDKILFAVEQLEKLLEKTQTLNLMIKSDHYVNEKRAKVVFEDVIMQKISELKGKVEDVKDYKD